MVVGCRRGWSFLSIHESDTEGVSKVLWDCGSFPEIALQMGGAPNTSGLGSEMRQEKSLELRFEFIFFYPPTLAVSLCWFYLGSLKRLWLINATREWHRLVLGGVWLLPGGGGVRWRVGLNTLPQAPIQEK